MKPLETNRQCLVWLCICPADKPTSQCQRLAHAICATIALTGLIAGFVASSAYAWKFISIDIGQTLYACTFLCGELSVFYITLVGMILKRHQINGIFENLSTIYKARKCVCFSFEVFEIQTSRSRKNSNFRIKICRKRTLEV